MAKKYVANPEKVSGSVLIPIGNIVTKTDPKPLDESNPNVAAAIDKGLLIEYVPPKKITKPKKKKEEPKNEETPDKQEVDKEEESPTSEDAEPKNEEAPEPEKTEGEPEKTEDEAASEKKTTGKRGRRRKKK
ncbi:MAG: hypothetical protein SVK08_01855 [Halobacteriota archaeon]|nr:hypothetical protein [Halobacteriota archaeon]